MKYLVICKTQGKNYLLMHDGKDGAIQAFENKDHVMDSFKNYVDKFKMDQTWVMSATMGMMQMNPIAIPVPADAEELRKYFVTGNIVGVSGGVIGNGYTGIEMNDEILQLQEFSIWDECMRRAGLKP